MNLSKNRLFCGVPSCRHTFQCSSNLKRHLTRAHSWPVTPRFNAVENITPGDDGGKYNCTVNYCKKVLDSFDSLLDHLRQHMKKSEIIQCPYPNCNSLFDKPNSFSSHKSKKHPSNSSSHEIPLAQEFTENNEDCSTGDNLSCNFQVLDGTIPAANFLLSDENIQTKCDSEDELYDSFLNNYAALLLKLECQYQLPALVVQYLVEEFQKIYDKSQEIVKKKLRDCLLEHNIETNIIDEVIRTVFDNDPFKQATSTLDSNYKRKVFYKKKFPFVEPVKVAIDENSFFYYVPIAKSLEMFVSDKSVKDKISLE